MPEMDFAGLRDAALNAFRPDYDQLRRLARRRLRNRTIGAGLATALIAAGLAGTTVAAGRPAVSQTGDLSASPSPEYLISASPSPSMSQGRRSTVGTIAAGDLDHLYVRYYDCASGTCRMGVARTADRGQTWHQMPLPTPPNSLGTVFPVGPRTLVVHYLPDGQFIPTKNWLASTDAGATWRPVTVTDAAAAPAGWRVLDPSPPDSGTLLAVDPATGAIVRLTKMPKLKQALLATAVPAGATLWMSGFTKATVGIGGRYVFTGTVVAVSHDHGRTWRQSRLPGDVTSAEDTGPVVATGDGTTVYAVGRVSGQLAIFISTDGGTSWRRTTATATVGERSVSAAVRPDGAVVIQIGTVAEEGVSSFVSTDRGETLRPTTPGPGSAAVPVAGGLVQSGQPLGGHAWISFDGVTWSYVAPPTITPATIAPAR